MTKYSKLLILNLILILFFWACSKSPQKNTLDGMVQGSYYHIIYYATPTQNQSVSQDLQNLFNQIDQSVSLWNKESLINQVNQNKDVELDSIFIDCFVKSQEISELTEGYLDCTIGALVEKYGFAAKEREEITQEQIDSLLQYVGYNNIKIENSRIKKKFAQTKIDFNAIAQGYTSDKIAQYFFQKGITNFIIDIAGEVRANGTKDNGKLWTCAIEQPSDSSNQERSYNTYLELKDQSIVTSGNYRKYYIDEKGNKKSHTIDPFTGRSVTHNLLSVSVVDKSATLCDGLATAFMVMGLEKSKTFLQHHPHIQAHFIYWDKNQYQTYTTPNLKHRINYIRE